jgi:exodeoxyribonuclease V alpha subunit
MQGITSSKFADIIAKARLKKLEAEGTVLQDSKKESNILEVTASLSDSNLLSSVTDKYGNTITYNREQQAFIDLASTHKSACLIGAAGTGKTTCMKGTVQALIQSPKTGILQNHDHRYLPHGVPGIVVCAYTRRATNNIRRNMDESMKSNCITIHKLLEYGPEYFPIVDADGNEKISMKFVPMRNHMNPLPSEITTIIFEESSMISTSLYAEVIAALPHDVQIIFLGDIQQLPPVFGPAILGFKLTSLPTIELTEVYRQALESPIIRLAHRILSGSPITPNELSSWHYPGQLKITPWKKKIDSESALEVSEKLFSKLYESKEYSPEDDIILIPLTNQSQIILQKIKIKLYMKS